MENLKKIEFGEIAELRNEKFNPLTSDETKPCLELEHFEQVTGKINGYVSSAEQKSIKNVFYKGDVLFGKLRPYLRKYWLAEFDGVCSSEVWVLKPKTKDISNEYLFNLIQTNDFIQAANVSSGSKMPRADWDYIINFPFSIINSKSEQKAIAQVLSTADAAIHTTEKLIAKKELRKKWLMQQLLTGKKRLNGFSGEWKEVKLEEVGDFFKGAGVSKSEIIAAGLPAVRYGELYTKYHFLISEITTFINNDSADLSRKIQKGDILFAGSGETIEEIGKCATYTMEEVAYAGGDIIVFRPYNSDSIFLGYLLNSAPVNSQKASMGKGHSVVHIYPKDIATISITIPEKEEQTAIAQVLQAADKEISLLKAKAAKLREQKKGLMQQLLTGKKRLKI